MPVEAADLIAIQADAAIMRELLHSDLWRAFLRHAEWELEAWKDRTLSESDKEFQYNKGCYEGMLAMIRLPDKILNLEAHLANREIFQG